MTEKALEAVARSSTTPTTTPACMATRPGQLNPYKLGIELYRDIEERWNKGRFGKEWDECDDLRRQRAAGTSSLGLGRKKIFEVRKLYNDITFIDEFFTPEFCERDQFFSFSLNDRTGNYEIESREFKKIKQKMLFQLTNFGEPFIFVEERTTRTAASSCCATATRARTCRSTTRAPRWPRWCASGGGRSTC